MSTPESQLPSAPPPSPPPQGAAPGQGSVGVGVLIAWACLIAGYFAVGVVVSAIGTISSSLAALVGLPLLLAPWILMIVFAVRFAGKGERQTAKGIGIGVASIFGVLLLLVAACFGLLSGTNFH